jgi:hypothetical protein
MEQHAALIRYLLDLADEARAPLPDLAIVAASSTALDHMQSTAMKGRSSPSSDPSPGSKPPARRRAGLSA